MYKLIIAILFIISTSVLSAQIKVISEQSYDAGALYGYMNGGSELYQEYNFKKLDVKEIEVNGQNLKYESYQMDSPISAYGIFSVNVFKCNPLESTNTSKICISDFQLQAVIGSSYISIINTAGNADSQDAAYFLYNDIVKSSTKHHSIEHPNSINRLLPDNIMYMNGHLAIENRASEWLEVYNNLGLKSCYILSWQNSQATMLVHNNTDISDITSPSNVIVKKKHNMNFYLMNYETEDQAEEIFRRL